MDFLEYSDINAEIKGCMTPGKLKMTDQAIVFKNSKTGKIEQFQASEIEAANFQNFIGTWGLRVLLKGGVLHRYAGFKESDKEKVSKFFNSSYKKEVTEKDISCKGWNWGTAAFNGSVLSFDIADKSAFEIPLNHVSQCLTGKNEITMEFHQNDDAPVSLMEMRFFIPPSELAGDVDAVEAFQKQVMNKASVINVSGDAIAIFREIQCLTPRGRYDIKIFQSFFQLHGKTFDYKIPMSTILRLFLLPHKDSRQMFFVISLDPPIKQGQTRYHFLVLLFGPDEETSIELPFTEEELKEKYEGKLEKELSGPTYEVFGKVSKNIINRKITGCGNFKGHSGTPAISCSFKAAAGYIYPLERGFIYIHKPPLHIRFEEINSVNFARGGGGARSFDFEIELKSGTVHTFSSIEKEEYGRLFDFISSKKLHVKNRGKNDKGGYNDDFGDSDNEAVPDAYLERVKAEAQERDLDDGDSDESTDEDFNPNQAESDVAEEYDSDPDTSSDEGDSEGGGDSGKEKKKKEKKNENKPASEKPRKRRTSKKKPSKDANRPKRPTTAFMIWLNETREKIKADNPGIKVTEIAKKGGEMWRELKDKSEWEKKAAKAKEQYEIAMKEYNESGGGAAPASDEDGGKKTSKAKPKAKPASHPSPDKSSGQYKSKEYISDDSSSDDGKGKSKRKASESGEKTKKKGKSKGSSDESEKEAKSKKESRAKENGSEDDSGKTKRKKSESENEEDISNDSSTDDGDDKGKGKNKRKASESDDADEKNKKRAISKGSLNKGGKETKSKREPKAKERGSEGGKGKKSASEDEEEEEEILSTPPSSENSDSD